MHRSSYIIGLLLFLCLTSFSSLARTRQAAASDNQHGYRSVPNVVTLAIRDYQPSASSLQRSGLAALDAQLQSLNIHELEQAFPAPQNTLQKSSARAGLDNIFYARFSGGRPPEEVAAELAKNPAIEFAEARYYGRLNAQPNDPLVSQQYYLRKTFLTQAWALVTWTQSPAVIAIIDNGTDITHPDLQPNLWTNPGEIADNGIDDDQNGLIDDVHGWNYVSNNNNVAPYFHGTYYSSHGTHTAGIACAVANNGLGIAGASWNARFMPLNVGSTTTDGEVDPLASDRAMIYAVEQGADVINCSFSGSYSNTSKRIVEYAAARGTAIVAAAGNGPSSADDEYPAAFPDVLSVANTDSSDKKYYGSNYGLTVDVTAPGVTILSTVEDGAYESADWSGTSMSAPLAAGIVALVKAHHPEWTGVQAAEQVRVTADNIDLKNINYIGKLGRGRVNAWRALTEAALSIRIQDFSCQDENNDGIIKPGEKVKLSITLINHLAPAGAVSLLLSSTSAYVDMRDAAASLASIAANQQITLENEFEFRVTSAAPQGTPIPFTLSITSGSYQDVDHFEITVYPQWLNLDINHIATTIPNNGRIGSLDVDSENAGIGLLYENGPSLLFEGAIIAGSSAATIVNSARSLVKWDNTMIHDADFVATADGDLRLATPGVHSDQESYVKFDDSGTGASPSVRITQQTYARDESPFNNIIIFRYQIQNILQTTRENFHFGLFFDWDMDDLNYDTNLAGYDASRNLGYAYDSGMGPDAYVGVRVLSNLPVSYCAIWNDETEPNNPSWGIYDGFSDEEKWQAISGGLQHINAGPSDISNVIAAGPMTIPAGNSAEVVFALVAANSLPALQTAADHALQMWNHLFETGLDVPAESAPLRFSLGVNYPNPFNPVTTIPFQIERETHVQLHIFDVRGRLVRSLLNAKLQPGDHLARWDGRDDDGRSLPSGTYFCELKSGPSQAIIKLLLIK